jgi:hypothetical protein
LVLLASLWAGGGERDGGTSSGGGDFRSIHFVRVAKVLSDLLPNLKNIKIEGYDLVKFKTAVAEIKQVECVPGGLSRGGIPKHGLNYKWDGRIVFDCNAWDDAYEGSRRAAFVLHEFAPIVGVNDEGYKYSSGLYENPTLKIILNGMSALAPYDSGTDLPFAIQCEVFDKGVSVSKFMPIGPVDNLAGNSSMGFFESYDVRREERGTLVAAVDTGIRPFINGSMDPNANVYGTPVKKPFVRVLIGYSSRLFHVDGFDGEVLAQTDLRVAGDLDAVVSAPEVGVEVRCKRLPTVRLVHTRNLHESGARDTRQGH